jgi:hypothetical protein
MTSQLQTLSELDPYANTEISQVVRIARWSGNSEAVGAIQWGHGQHSTAVFTSTELNPGFDEIGTLYDCHHFRVDVETGNKSPFSDTKDAGDNIAMHPNGVCVDRLRLFE